jgi:glycosyltransferase involved in cell wall biosynthesis
MKILFITALPLETNNSSQIRNIALIKGLLTNGCSVTILCPGSEHSTNKIYADSFPKVLDEVEIIRISKKTMVTSFLSTSAVQKKNIKTSILKYARRLYSRFSIYKAAGLLIGQTKKLNYDYSNFDIILSSSDPKASHKMAEMIKKKTNLKWIQYWGDPLLADITDSTLLPNILKRHIESNLMKGSDFIFYVSPFTSDEQKILYPKYRNKIYHLPPPYIKERIYKKSQEGRFTLGYFGSYYSRVRNILPLIECVKSSKRLDLLIAGNTDLNIEMEKCSDIKIYQRVNREKVEELEGQCDALVCVLNLKGTQIPGKIYQYASSNKPIILITDGNKKHEITEYFTQFDRFIICENNESSITASINEMLFEKREYYPCKAFSSDIVARKMINIIIGQNDC